MAQIIKIPGINGLGKTQGAKNASDLIVNTKNKLELNQDNLKEQQEKIYEKAKEALQENKKAIFIGGDHSISYPLTKAFTELHENSKIIVFDAHPDLMPPMQEPTHEEWLRALIEKENYLSKNIILIGARKIEPEEHTFLEKHNIKQISIELIREEPKEAIKKIISKIEGKETYISFDIDVIDEKFVPATGYPEESGLSIQVAKQLIEEIIQNSNVIAADLVELHTNYSESEVDKTTHAAKEILDSLKKI